ncbi:MAG: hypothetical protein MHPSP_001705, partial [Paramarteilia canceri]
CSMCSKWQHGNCISLTESNPPSIYACFECLFLVPDPSVTPAPVLIATIKTKNSQKRNSTELATNNIIETFQIGHSIDTYRNILKRMDEGLLNSDADLDTLINQLKTCQ